MSLSGPWLAFTQRVMTSEHGERRDAIDRGWYRIAAAIGVLPLPLPNHLPSALGLLNTLAPCGVVLTGGNDLARYGGDAPERDATEAAIVEHAHRVNLPLLGVCRGMQLLFDREGIELSRVVGHVTGRMEVQVQGKTMFVNSYHHWAACNTPQGWDTWAQSEDGVIKAARHRQRPWQAIMWHPEREASLREHDRLLFTELFCPQESACEG